MIDPPGAHHVGRARIDGQWLLVDTCETIGRTLAYGQVFEPLELRLFRRLVQPGGVVLDVGANFGLYSVAAASRLGSDGVLHAFEPNPRALELLRKNLETRPRAVRVGIHAQALGAAVGRIAFACSEDSAFSSAVAAGRSPVLETVDVPQTSLDAFVAEQRLPRVDLAKIDVEGYEPEVLAGGRSLLERPDAPTLLIEIAEPNLRPRGLSQLDVVGTLVKLGFEVRAVTPGAPAFRELPDPARHENFVAVKPERAGLLESALAGK
jgi:FkbM family methyltransferase